MPHLIHMSVLQRLCHFLTTHCKSLQQVYVLLDAHASLNFPLSLNFAHLTFSNVLSVCVSMLLLSIEGPESMLQYVAVCCSMLQYVAHRLQQQWRQSAVPEPSVLQQSLTACCSD